MPAPKNIIPIGRGVELQPVESLARGFNISMKAAYMLLSALKVPIACVGDTAYFRVSALEEAIFLMLDLGGPGFLAPGSGAKARSYSSPYPMSGEYELPEKLLDPKKRSAAQGRLDKLGQARSKRNRSRVRKLVNDFAKQVGPIKVDDDGRKSHNKS